MWRSVFSHTNSSDTDGFEELDRYYLEPDGFFLLISNSRDEQSEVPKTSVSVNAYENEQATTSEIDEAPKTSVYINNFEHEESPTSENYSTDLFNGVLPESSDMNKSEENEQNADQGSFQREDKETFFSRVQTNLSALSSIITAPVESVGRGVIFVTRHIFNIGRATFTSPTSETEKSSTSETTEVPSPSVSVNNFEYEQSPSSETTKIPTTGVNMNNAEDEKSSASERCNTDLLNAILPEPSDNGPKDNEQNVVPGSLQTEEEETISSKVQTSAPNLYSSCRIPDVPVGLREAFITSHLLNIGRTPFTSNIPNLYSSGRVPDVPVGLREAFITRHLLNIGRTPFTSNIPNLYSSGRVPDVPVGLREAFITRHLLNIGRAPFTSNIPNLYSSCKVPDVPVGLREAFISRHLLNIGHAPFTSVTTPTSETSETAKVPKTTVSINNLGHEDSPTSESYSIDLFNVGLPASSDNRSEENESNIVQGTLEREDEDPVVSRIHRNLSGFNSLITAPVVLAGQGVIFVTRHILNICGAPFTSLFNHFSAIIQRMFPIPHRANSGLIPTIRRWLDIISWMTSVIGALALLVLLIIILKIVVMVTH
ncbi:uncharacterized protein LOC109203125 [Oreochromis niloticus]|uniref:uncharacterized protein LOC109203125 n=1 Tax=Oreochromis niloticus TaxID=8128 RepID=UPI000904E218|nr:uncharacterized protein LOC109203125 [Oreochromis niloticus]XP_025765823.1 uncharacterized protein LOC109203125 [Oreochromis niloticus]